MDTVFVYLELWTLWDLTGFDREGLVFAEPWQRDHGHLLSRVGMTLWNLRSLCLVQTWLLRTMQKDCRVDRTNPSCYSPKALVLREDLSSRLEIWLRHSWKRFNSLNKIHATTMLVQWSPSRCWRVTDGRCTTGVRRWRVLHVCFAPALELTLTRNTCQLHRLSGQLEADLRNYGTPHWWRTMKRFGIETCAQLGWISRGRWCGTGMITTKVIQSALIQVSVPPTAFGIRSENCKKELSTDLFKDGHVIGMYWENIARSMVERANRDAQFLDVPLFCWQAADQRHSRKNKAIDKQLTHQLLTVPNPHRTGKLQGMLLVHENMVVRLADVLAPQLGLVKDKLAVVVKVDLHHEDQKRLDRREAGFCHFFRTTWPKVSGWNYLKERIRPWKMLCCRCGKKSFRMWPITQLTQRHCSLWNWCMQSSKLIWS